jgi:glycosyltransferase involved in cell wall biosynthesis
MKSWGSVLWAEKGCSIAGAPAERTDGKRPLEIALVHAADYGGGAERCVLTLHRSLRQLGHHSRLFVGCKHTDDPDVFEIVRNRPLPGLLRVTRWLENEMGWQNLYAPWFRELHCQIGRADVLNIHSLWGGTYGYADLTGISRLTRRYPTVMSLHDGFMMTGHCACPIQCERWQVGCGRCPDLKRTPAIPRDVTAQNWRRKFHAIQCSQLRVTTVSHWLRTQVEQSPIFSGKPVSVIHNSIDESVFFPDSQRNARAELGLPMDEFLVLLAGQTVEGIHEGIAQQGVAALNRWQTEGITALIVGHSAPLVAETLTKRAVVRPFQKTPQEMAQYYRAADVVLVCSEYETFGRVAAEAVLCGTPVISFATGGLTDIVVPDVTGWRVPTGDVDGLVKALGDAMERRETLIEFGRSASRWAMSRFSMEVIARNYLDVYLDQRKSVLGDSSSRKIPCC